MLTERRVFVKKIPDLSAAYPDPLSASSKTVYVNIQHPLSLHLVKILFIVLIAS